MYTKSVDTALLVIVSTTTVMGIVTTIVIVALSFGYFKSM